MVLPTETHRSARWRDNVHVYIGPVKFDSRMFKITRSLAAKGFAERVFIVGIWEKGLARHEALDARRQIRRFRLLIPRVSGNSLIQLLRLAEFSIRTLLFSVGKKVDLINCHMLVVLPVCLVLRRLLGAQLVYEPREIESEQEGIAGRRSQLLQRMERRLLPSVDMVVHVGMGCAQWYRETYALKSVEVLNNAPSAAEAPAVASSRILRDRFQIPAGDLIFIFQGHLREERGMAMMLDVFSACPDKSRHLVVMGFGPCQAVVEERAGQHSNIHFLPAVPQARIIEHTAGADVGLCVLVGTSTNTRLMNPNKLNEYFIAGIPVIVSDLPEPARFVRERECGWVIAADESALAAIVARVSREDVARLRKRIEQIRGGFGWEQEEKTLVRVYDDLWTRSRGVETRAETGRRQ